MNGKNYKYLMQKMPICVSSPQELKKKKQNGYTSFERGGSVLP